MSEYRSNLDPAGLAARLREAKRALVLSHAKPDGDAIGSCLAVRRLLEPIGVETQIALIGPVEPALGSLIEGESAVRIVDPKSPPSAEELAEWLGRFDTIAIVDTGTFGQIEPLAEAVRPCHDRVVGIDHHARGDEAVASRRWIDSTCASTTEMLAKLAEVLEVPLSPAGRGSLGEAIFVGLATDTGWFRFPSAGPRQFSLAARLLEAGVEKDRLYAQLEQQGRSERLAALGRALRSLEVVPFGGDPRRGFAVMTLSHGDFAETGATSTDVGGLVNEPLAVAGIVASVLLSEPEPGVVRMSFRSAGAAALPPGLAATSGAAIDVNELASRFGGGGHVAAAGARERGSLEAIRAKVLDELSRGA